jgi:hypothetical protein
MLRGGTERRDWEASERSGGERHRRQEGRSGPSSAFARSSKYVSDFVQWNRRSWWRFSWAKSLSFVHKRKSIYGDLPVRSKKGRTADGVVDMRDGIIMDDVGRKMEASTLPDSIEQSEVDE